jgi:hypothetical protein
VKGPIEPTANPADRLRAAADRLDDATHHHPEWYAQDFATAAVLRAVAEQHSRDHMTGFCECRDDFDDDRCEAALALADTILGDVK